MKNENLKGKLTPPVEFYGRVARHFVYAIIFIVFSLCLGTIGYHYLGLMGWIDAFYNASMILTGMGPVNIISHNSGKIFSSLYALYSGIAFLSAVAVIFTPIVHRFLHIFNLEDEQ